MRPCALPRGLSPDCLKLLDKACKIIDVGYRKDPKCRVANDQLALAAFIIRS
jgi:hypothetical protein